MNKFIVHLIDIHLYLIICIIRATSFGLLICCDIRVFCVQIGNPESLFCKPGLGCSCKIVHVVLNNCTSTLFDYAGCMRIIYASVVVFNFQCFCRTQVSHEYFPIPQTFYEHLKYTNHTGNMSTVSN